MRIIKPTSKVVFHQPEGFDSIEKFTEWVGRTCYKSEDKITEDSASKFVTKLRMSGHWAMLEHCYATVEFVADRGFCYDDQTEVLTMDGWKLFKDTYNDDKFLTLNMRSKQAEYQMRTGVTVEEWDDDLIYGESTMVDFAVTPNHRMLWYHYDSRKQRDWKINKAEEVYGRRVKFKRGLFKEMPSFKFTSYPQSGELDFARFLGVFVTDGTLCKGENSGGRVTLCQTKQVGRKYIKRILRSLGWIFKEKKEGFRINNTKLYNYLRLFFPKNEKKTYDGRCPYFVRFASRDYIKAFLEGVVVGDGNVHKKNGHRVVYTASKGFAGDLQELFMKAGECASVRIDDRIGQKREVGGNIIENKVVSYIVSVTRRTDEHLFNRHHWSRRHYKGNVYCVTVPNGTLYVRRNGKAFWSGNTHELVRHRLASFAQESTRYCNYACDKFDNQITVIEIPEVEGVTQELLDHYQESMAYYEKAYFKAEELAKSGGIEKPAQIARMWLPIGVKAEIKISANLREWNTVFGLRADEPAHPIMQGLARTVLKQFFDRVPAIYTDVFRKVMPPEALLECGELEGAIKDTNKQIRKLKRHLRHLESVNGSEEEEVQNETVG